MDGALLLFPFYAVCLFGVLALLVLVVRKHKKSEREANLHRMPSWQFRTQEALSLLALLSALVFGVLSLCARLGAVQIEASTLDTVLFLTTSSGHMTMLLDIWLTFGVLQPLRFWGVAAAAILAVDSASVVVTAVQVGTKKTLASQILPPILTTLVDGNMALFTAMALRDAERLAPNTKPYLSTSAILRHLHLVPLWIWPFLGAAGGHVGALACQYAQMLATVYPWRYLPPLILLRCRRRSVVGENQVDGQAESHTDGSESTRELVHHKSQDTISTVPLPPSWQDPVPAVSVPSSMATKTEQRGRGDPDGQV